jgi:hypothetical protein
VQIFSCISLNHAQSPALFNFDGVCGIFILLCSLHCMQSPLINLSHQFVIISVAFYGMLDLDFPVYADWGTPSSVVAGVDGGGGGQGRTNRGAGRGGRGGDGGRNKRKRDDGVDDSNADRPSNSNPPSTKANDKSDSGT